MTLRAQDGQPRRLQHPDAFLLDIQGGIDIPVMMSTAMRACPVASCETQRLQPMPAGGTRLRRREEGADLHKDLALLLRLVFALAHELAPSHVGNSPCKMVVLHHVFDS